MCWRNTGRDSQESGFEWLLCRIPKEQTTRVATKKLDSPGNFKSGVLLSTIYLLFLIAED